jgi:hypothetical protein
MAKMPSRMIGTTPFGWNVRLSHVSPYVSCGGWNGFV